MKKILLVLVAVHFAALYWHGDAHGLLQVNLSFGQKLFAYPVIVFGPVLGAVLLLTKYEQTAAWLVLLCMVGAFWFGVYHHYILVSPDHIHHLPQGTEAAQSQFIDSALLNAVLEFVTAIAAAYLVGNLFRKQG